MRGLKDQDQPILKKKLSRPHEKRNSTAHSRNPTRRIESVLMSDLKRVLGVSGGFPRSRKDELGTGKIQGKSGRPGSWGKSP